ncbi:MAG TPA: MBL fold metallo-hydrolase [Armatimonadota bacterium]|nr:MBL fold metallo-hydrolase [Armatimonadota bacterium]
MNSRSNSRKVFWLLVVIILLIGGMVARKITHIHSPKVSIPSSSFTLTVIDVGQGDSILLQTGTKTMLVDAGDGEHGDTVVDYLSKANVKQIDLLVATHPHEDHIGGMAGVLAAFPVKQVWDSGFNQGSHTQQEFLQTIHDKNISYQNPRAGDTINLGDSHIAVLAPVGGLLHDTDSDANNNSIVLRVSYGKVSVLLTGDMEEAERGTVSTWPRSTVLKVAHHGSHNGTDAQFVREISPSLAVISCGLNNPFGHPHASTLAALHAAGVPVKITKDDGNVIITSDGESIHVTTQENSSTISSDSNRNEETSITHSPPPSPPVDSGGYIGNMHSHVFHRSSCESLPAEHNRVYFSSRTAAIREGYHPCGRCAP